MFCKRIWAFHIRENRFDSRLDILRHLNGCERKPEKEAIKTSLDKAPRMLILLQSSSFTMNEPLTNIMQVSAATKQ